MRLLTVLCVFSVLIAGCAAPRTMYYWDDYSSTLYALESDPSAEHLNEHIVSLQNIVSQSEEKNMRVAPGIYAELGYWLAKAGRGSESVPFYKMEAQVYPESQLLMNIVITQANAKIKKGGK